MRYINNVGIEPLQRHTVPLGDDEITVIIRFLPVVEIWVMDVSWKGRNVYGIKLTSWSSSSA